MMRITYTKGRTVNLGNFESSRVDIGITLDCDDGDENPTLERMKAWVDSKLAKETARG